MKPYAFGDSVSVEELDALLAVFVSDVRKRRKLRRTPGKFLSAAHAMLPNRVEHEVNRCRGIAFDAGEHGFSYSVEQVGEP